ncbi:MAG: 4Fe-4S binding protein [Bacteroidota bacterium]
MKSIQVISHYCPKNHPCPVIRLCPVGAITQKTIYSAPVIDEEKCTKCGKCTSVCFTFQKVA